MFFSSVIKIRKMELKESSIETDLVTICGNPAMGYDQMQGETIYKNIR